MDYLENIKQQLKQQGELFLKVKVTPCAPKSEIFNQLADGTLKVRLQAPPENGKANKALIKLFEKEFNAQIKITNGETNTRKTIQLYVQN